MSRRPRTFGPSFPQNASVLIFPTFPFFSKTPVFLRKPVFTRPGRARPKCLTGSFSTTLAIFSQLGAVGALVRLGRCTLISSYFAYLLIIRNMYCMFNYIEYALNRQNCSNFDCESLNLVYRGRHSLNSGRFSSFFNQIQYNPES